LKRVKLLTIEETQTFENSVSQAGACLEAALSYTEINKKPTFTSDAMTDPMVVT
jgi:hypothetical protein